MAPAREHITPPEAPITIIRPARAWQWLDVRELWQFRGLIYFLIWRDVKVRYKQTVLGARAIASLLLQISRSTEDFLEKIKIPAGLAAFASNTTFLGMPFD
jgi:lipopolysaccharide transport system permease protein